MRRIAAVVLGAVALLGLATIPASADGIAFFDEGSTNVIFS